VYVCIRSAKAENSHLNVDEIDIPKNYKFKFLRIHNFSKDYIKVCFGIFSRVDQGIFYFYFKSNAILLLDDSHALYISCSCQQLT
jgi:hypothetical protein